MLTPLNILWLNAGRRSRSRPLGAHYVDRQMLRTWRSVRRHPVCPHAAVISPASPASAIWMTYVEVTVIPKEVHI